MANIKNFGIKGVVPCPNMESGGFQFTIPTTSSKFKDNGSSI